MTNAKTFLEKRHSEVRPAPALHVCMSADMGADLITGA